MARGKFTSPTLNLDITAEAWEEAKTAASGRCLIADAIKRQYPHLSSVSVDMSTIRVSDKKKGMRYMYLTPDDAAALLLAFDQGWSQPDTHKLTIRAAVRTTVIRQAASRAAKNEAKKVELEAKVEAGEELTPNEKRSLSKLKAAPKRPTREPKAEATADPAKRTVHGRLPRKGPDDIPNLLRGRDRQYGKQRAKPAQVFADAVSVEVERRLAELAADA